MAARRRKAKAEIDSEPADECSEQIMVSEPQVPEPIEPAPGPKPNSTYRAIALKHGEKRAAEMVKLG